MVSRRDFLKRTFLIGTGAMMPLVVDPLKFFGRLPQGQGNPDTPKPAYSTPSLNPTSIPKYVADLIIPPAMPKRAVITDADGITPVDYYEIGVRQFQQQVLPNVAMPNSTNHFPKTTVWGYGPAGNVEGDFANFNFPSFTIEATQGTPVRVRWVNQLYRTVNGKKSYLPHLLPVDPTLHWANPAGPETDMMPMFETTPGPYMGPVPMVPHVHGAHVGPESDGYAEAWWLPSADDIPTTFFRQGKWYAKNKDIFENQHGKGTNAGWTADSAVFQYPNDQRAGTIWYHDHTMGMTRLNVYAGPAGFFLIRGSDGVPSKGTLPGPAPALGDPAGTQYYEIPIAIQDRSFNLDEPNNEAPLFYPDSRAFFDGFTGPYVPTTDIHPIWNPEFFGNTIVVNGQTWPKLSVEPRRYRFRFLNGCNARALIIKLVVDPNETRPATTALPMWVIGTEGGFLPDQAVRIGKIAGDPAQAPDEGLLMMPAERYDVIIDFSKVPFGSSLYLINEAPDEPFGGGPVTPEGAAPVATTGVVMRFDIDKTLTGTDTSADPSVPGELVLPPLPAAADANVVAIPTRQVSLNEMDSEVLTNPAVGPLEALLGTLGTNAQGAPTGIPSKFVDTVSEVIKPGATEDWEFFNFTADAHPIHLHQVMFQVLNREDLDPNTGMPTQVTTPPTLIEMGYKDTVISYPGTITRIRAKFDLPGRYVWHCHIVEHEDSEMMRPFDVAYVYHLPLVGK